MTKHTINIIDEPRRARAIEAVRNAPLGKVVIIQDPTRTTDQNSKMWPMLNDLSKQVVWHGFVLSDDEWKDFATATLKKQKIVPNMDCSGFIAVGGKTSKLSKSKMSDLIEIIYMLGAQNDVAWSESAQEAIRENRK
jgi:hypothetical protein